MAFRQLLLPLFPKHPTGVGSYCKPCGFVLDAEGQPTARPISPYGAKSDSAVWKAHLKSKHKELFETLMERHSGVKRPSEIASGNAAVAHSVTDESSVMDLTEASAHSSKRTKLSDGSSAATSTRSSTAVSHPPITDFLKKKPSSSLAAFVRWLSVSSISHHAAQSEECRHFLASLGWHGSFPSDHTMRMERTRQAEELRDQLGGKLAHRVVTVACDGWTNVQQSKVTNVVVIVNAQAYYWCSIVNSEERNTAEWMAGRLLPVLHTLIREWDARIAGFAVDNEAVNGSCFKLLRKDLPPLVHIPCAAHTVQLVVRSCLEHPFYASIAQQLTSLIRYFDAKEHRVALLQLQKARGVKQLRVVKPVDTRWNSLLAAAKRMKELQAEARCCFTAAELPSVFEDFWQKLQLMIDFLEPFRIATDAVQSDSATLFTVYQQFVLLQQHVKSHAGEAQQWAASSIMDRWKKLINVSAVTACAFLSFIPLPPALSQAKAQQFILDWGTSYLHYYHLVPEGYSRSDIRDTLLEQLAEFNGRLGEFASLDGERQSLQRKADAAHPFVPKLVWLLHSTLELSKVAVALLSLTPSEAAVERSFSAQGNVHTKLRNRMAEQSVQDEMLIKFNSKLLAAPASSTSASRASTSKVGKTVELSPNSDSDESSSDSEDAFLFAPVSRRTFAVAVAAAVPMDEEDSDTDIESGEDDAAGRRKPQTAAAAAEDEEEKQQEAAAPLSAAARRAARRAESIVFQDVDAFLAWFIRTRHLTSGSAINADVHNDLQQNSQSKLPIANAPSTKELVKRIRALLQPLALSAAAASSAAAAAAECS